jgi:hypothetical protein
MHYVLVDADGDPIDHESFAPYPTVHPVEVVGIEFDDFGNPAVMTLRYLHEISDEEQTKRVKMLGQMWNSFTDASWWNWVLHR